MNKHFTKLIMARANKEFLDRVKKIAYNHKIRLIENNKKPYHLLENDKVYCFLIYSFSKEPYHLG